MFDQRTSLRGLFEVYGYKQIDHGGEMIRHIEITDYVSFRTSDLWKARRYQDRLIELGYHGLEPRDWPVLNTNWMIKCPQCGSRTSYIGTAAYVVCNCGWSEHAGSITEYIRECEPFVPHVRMFKEYDESEDFFPF